MNHISSITLIKEILTKKHEMLRFNFNLIDLLSQVYYAQYDRFAVGSEAENYTLSLGGYSGTAGDALLQGSPDCKSAKHCLDGMMFSTRDRDNDIRNQGNCALQSRGGWWYRSCSKSNLNSLHGAVGRGHQYMRWYPQLSDQGGVIYSEMKIKYN